MPGTAFSNMGWKAFAHASISARYLLFSARRVGAPPSMCSKCERVGLLGIERGDEGC